MQLQRTVIAGFFLLTSGFLAACSGAGGGGDEDLSPLVSPTDQTVATQALSAFATPGGAFETLPSSTPGIATWTFYASPNGIVAVGRGESDTPLADVAMLSVSDGSKLQVTGTAYTISDELDLTPQALLAGLTNDLDTQTPTDIDPGLVGADLREVDGLVSTVGNGLVTGGKALVKACGTTLLGVFKGALIAGAGLAAGAALGAVCPETGGLGCAAGAWAARTGVVYGAGQVCPNLPTSRVGSVTGLFTGNSTPAM